MSYTLLQASGEGHTYLPKEELFFQGITASWGRSSYMEKHLMDMVVDRKLDRERDRRRCCCLSCKILLSGVEYSENVVRTEYSLPGR